MTYDLTLPFPERWALAKVGASTSVDIDWRWLKYWERRAMMDAVYASQYRDGQYRIVYGDLASDQVVVLQAAPSWLFSAMHGGIMPPVEAHGTDELHTAEPIGPLTEEQAMEYLVKKDVPREVWDCPGANRPRFRIVRADALPQDRELRDAWEMMEAA